MTGAHGMHYTASQVADKWNVSRMTVYRLFNNEPGVLILGGLSSKRRTRNEIRIPEDVLERVYKRRVR